MKENVQLAPYTTFRIGGPARYFFDVKNLGELKEAAEFAKNKNLPIFILGGGSNILVRDEGFPGVVIKISLKGIEIEDRGADFSVRAAAGENWDFLVETLVSKNIGGLENMTAVPGNVGAAPIQNIGCYGAEVSEFVSKVEFFNTGTLETGAFSKEECEFSYRDSIFKRTENKKLVVTMVYFIFPKNHELNLSYKDLRDYFAASDKKPSIKNIREALVEIRRKKLPDLEKVGSAGSFFKNPIVSKEEFKNINKIVLAERGGIPGNCCSDPWEWEITSEKNKISAACLVHCAGFVPGTVEGNVGTHSKQALALVNYGRASSGELERFVKKIIKTVKNKFEVTLENEVQII